ATPRPRVDCTVRDTISGAAMPGMVCASSNPMACATCGSPNTVANRYASAAAATPTSMPRISRARADMEVPRRSVAGEAEQVPAVVGELVHPVPRNQGGGALFGADEVDRHHRQKQAEDGPGQQLPHRNSNRDGAGNSG